MIVEVTCYQEGAFPFRYLGVPSTSNTLNKLECRKLPEKMTKKIKMWATKTTSYSGRVTLINIMLMGIYSFWAAVFMIPSGVIKEVEKICRNFLWGAHESCKKIPYVAWDNICKPKKYGGLGLRNLDAWNKASLAKLVWAVAMKKDSLWMKWVHERYIKDGT